MAVELRRLGPADLPLLDHVAEDVFDGPILPDQAVFFLASSGYLLVVALSGHEVVGQITGMIHRHPDGPPQLYVDNLGVTPARQRQGIGRALIREMIAWGKSLGCEEAWIATERQNTPARRLYADSGFAEQTVAYFERKL